MKNIDNIESKNILKIKRNKREIKYIKEIFEVPFNTIIDSLLFAFLFFNTLLTLISYFFVNKIIVVC